MSASALSRSRIGNAKTPLHPYGRNRPRSLCIAKYTAYKVKGKVECREREARSGQTTVGCATPARADKMDPKAVPGEVMWFKSFVVASLLQLSLAGGANAAGPFGTVNVGNWIGGAFS